MEEVEYLDDDTDTEEFDMDLLGNRESVTIDGGTPETYAVNDATNRYDEAVGTFDVNLLYDNAGNTTTDQNDYVYTYDYENRVDTIKRSDSTTIVEYTYDALGRRIRKDDAITGANSRLYYYSDQWQVLEEYDTTDETPVFKADFVYGNYIDEALRMSDGTDEHYYVHNHLYSTVALLDDTGSLAERYEYDAYGKCRFLNTTTYALLATQASAAGNPYLFTGRRLDTLDGGDYSVYYYRNRYYDADTGRFLQKDPLGVVPDGDMVGNSYRPLKQYMDGVGIYAYNNGNPICRLDSYGLWGTLIHYTKTKLWASKCGYPSKAAEAVAAANEAVDDLAGDRDPLPIGGDQSYHFNIPP